jgi:hypothetical protein
MNEKSTLKIDARVLLQVDLEGHTSWMGNAKSKADVAVARFHFAQVMRECLEKKGFTLLSWKGDGGVYHSAPTKPDFDFAVEAAESSVNAFWTWRAGSQDRKVLRFRISIHYAPDVYMHPSESGYLASDDLNLFLKHERDFGVSGTLAVTQAVFRHLSGQTQGRFQTQRSCSFGVRPGESLISSVHYLTLSSEVDSHNVADLNFFEWVAGLHLPRPTKQDLIVGPSSLSRLTLDGAAFLYATPHPDSPVFVELTAEGRRQPLTLGIERDAEWTELEEELRYYVNKGSHGDGRKVSPLRLVRPISEVPLVKVEYCVEKWSHIRAFHRLVEKYPSIRERFANTALDVQQGFSYPGIVCCHIVVRTADAGTPRVLICQRQQRGHDSTYYPGNWSISIEEQLMPDESINTCVSRGISEELVGQTAAAGVTSRVLAAVLETSILNLAFLVLVDIPLTFDQIVQRWSISTDKDEHRQIAALDLDRNLLSELAVSNSFTENCRAKTHPADPESFRSNTIWSLHPTSLARATMYV